MRIGSESVRTERREVDARSLAGDELGDELAGDATHREAEVVVPEREERVRVARRACGDRLPLWTDANASFSLASDLDAFRAMDDFGLLFPAGRLKPLDQKEKGQLAMFVGH